MGICTTAKTVFILAQGQITCICFYMMLSYKYWGSHYKDKTVFIMGICIPKMVFILKQGLGDCFPLQVCGSGQNRLHGHPIIQPSGLRPVSVRAVTGLSSPPLPSGMYSMSGIVRLLRSAPSVLPWSWQPWRPRCSTAGWSRRGTTTQSRSTFSCQAGEYICPQHLWEVWWWRNNNIWGIWTFAWKHWSWQSGDSGSCVEGPF